MLCPDTTETVEHDRTAATESQESLLVFVLLSYDTVFKPTLLYHLLLRRGQHVSGVAEVRTRAKKGGQKRKLANNSRRFGVWGSKGAVWFGLWTVFNKLRSALPTPSVIRTTSTIRRVCKLFGVPYVQVDELNGQEFFNDQEASRPDVLLSFQHKIFRDRLVNLPRLACINCHPAKLPGSRGNKPLFWVMADRQATFGVTVHTMTPEIHGGEILSQIESPTRWEIDPGRPLPSRLRISRPRDRRSHRPGEEPSANTIPIDNSTKYYKRPTSGDIQCFQQSGRMAI